jgi:hypothetical protein
MPLLFPYATVDRSRSLSPSSTPASPAEDRPAGRGATKRNEVMVLWIEGKVATV